MKKVKFSELRTGDIFKFNEEWCLKTVRWEADAEGLYLADSYVNLVDPTMTAPAFDENQEVEIRKFFCVGNKNEN